MSMSIEEILRSNTIHELRDLVTTLEKDSTTKKTELQQMVGSTYHDFIQSADVIAEMQQSADSLSHELSHFWKMSLDVVSKTNEFLSKQREEAPVQRLEPRRDVSCESGFVWLFLDEGKVYDAAKIIAEANVIRHNVLLNLPALRLTKHSHHHTSAFGASQTLFLKETVLDDCYLSLGEAAEAEGLARCLAAICLLDASAENVIDKYFATAKHHLVSIFTSSDDLSTTLIAAVNYIKQCMKIFHNVCHSKLLSRLVQEAIRDILGSTSYKEHEKTIQQYVDKLQPVVASWNTFFTEATEVIQKNLYSALGGLNTPSSIQTLRKSVYKECTDTSLPMNLLKREQDDALWSLIFQDPFTEQVESMLKASFLEAFEEVVSKIDAVVQASGVKLQQDAIILGNVLSFSSSSVICQRARGVWDMIEAHLKRLACSASNESEGDALDETLEVCTQEQVCILFGQVLTYIRLFISKLSQHQDNPLPVMNAMLMLCRIAWQIRSNCARFIPSAPLMKGKGYVVSVEQLLSAFDIADTDGDSIISYDEAMEALDAIRANDASTPELRLAGTKLTATYTSYELRLLATEIIERDVVNANNDVLSILRNWRQCVEHCCDNVVSVAIGNYGLYMKNHFSKINSSSGVAKYMWKEQIIDGSTILLPCTPSDDIYGILLDVHRLWSTLHVSVDTVMPMENAKSLSEQMMNCMISSATEVILNINLINADEDFMLQRLFDFLVCASVTNNHTFDAKIKLLRSKIDLVIMQLASSLLQDNVDNFLAQVHLLLPIQGTLPTVAKPEQNDVKCLFAEMNSKQKFAMLPLPIHTPSIATVRVPAKLKKQSTSTEKYGIGKVFSGISENLGGFLG